MDGDAIDEFFDAREDAIEDDDVEDDDAPFELWPECVDSVRVFSHAHWERIVAGDRLLVTGLAHSELIATCQLLDLPAARWPQVLADVTVMVAAVLPELQRST